MCGIAGIWGRAEEGRLRRMVEALRHRGPDDERIWLAPDAPLGFAHCRLSIIDLATGQQPVFNETGRMAVLLNGEIYNYQELRAELAARGHLLRTRSDTEVIVHLYEESGLDFVARLRGMFAIALWDGDACQLVLARDRAGKKPLYFTQTGDEFRFGSEIKALAAVCDAALTLDEQAVADYLAWGEVPQPGTIYREIRSLEPAELMVVRDGRIALRHRYWKLAMTPKTTISFEEAVEQTDALLQEAVRLRLRSDVPVGSFLSGGIDSGIVTAMAAQAYPGRLVTVTIGFPDAAFDERPAARLVAERYGTDHHEILVQPDVARDLPTIAAAYDQPFGDSSAVPSFYVARAARQFVKVVLNGDGGDELFAGYRRYLAARINHLLAWSDNDLCRPVWRLLAGALPVPRGYRTPYAFVHRLIRGMAQDPVNRYFAWALDGLTTTETRRLCGLNGRHDVANDAAERCWMDATQPAIRNLHTLFAEMNGYGYIDQMLAADYQTVLPYDLLVKMDIACMAHGLEARSPLLDHVLTERVACYPERAKLRGTRTKPLLRTLGERYLPPATTQGPKRGFEVPVVQWLRGELRPLLEDVVLARNGLAAELFDRAALENLVRGTDTPDPARWGRRAWTMLMLGLWDACVRPRWQRTGSAA